MTFNSSAAIPISLSLALLVSGCAAPHPSSVPAPHISARPVPPRRGEPINPVDLLCYFQMASSNLVRQGQLGTNPLRQLPGCTCHLRLPSPPSSVLRTDEIADKLEMAVVVVGRVGQKRDVVYIKDTATGFFISDSGAIVTCWHVLAGDHAFGFSVLARDGGVFPVRNVLAVNTNRDLAILQVEGRGFTALPVAPSPRQGSSVWVLGHPFPWYYMLTAGIVSGYYIANDRHIVDITADLGNGSSGSPVVNEYGAVVGVACFKHQTVTPGSPELAVKGCAPSSELLEMIEQESRPSSGK